MVKMVMMTKMVMMGMISMQMVILVMIVSKDQSVGAPNPFYMYIFDWSRPEKYETGLFLCIVFVKVQKS